MLKLSQAKSDLLQRLIGLTTTSSYRSDPARHDDEVADLLDRLAATIRHEVVSAEVAIPEVVGYLARYLFAQSEQVRQSARAVVSKTVLAIRPYDLLSLGEHMKYYRYDSSEWARLVPADLARFATGPDGTTYAGVLGLLSFHHNGYVRLEAVRLLSRQFDRSEFPFLLIRQNDWVQPIVASAQRAVAERIHDGYVQHLARCLRLILHLKACGRQDHQYTVDRAINLLLDEKHGAVLQQVILTADRRTRRHVVQHGLTSVGSHQARIVRTGLACDDEVIRRLCSTRLAAAFESNQLRQVLEGLIADPLATIRREAFTFQASHFPELAEATWRSSLLDSSRLVRELARFSLGRLGLSEAAIATLYRARIAEQPDFLPAIQGLAETGDSSDVEYFQSLRRHPWTSRRIAAIRGIHRTCDDTNSAALFEILLDDRASVVREIRKAIEARRAIVPGEAVLPAALHAADARARESAVRLIADFGKWRSLPWLVRVAANAPPATAHIAGQLIEEWLAPPKANRVFTRPTPTETAEIAKAISESGRRISSGLVDLIHAEVFRCSRS